MKRLVLVMLAGALMTAPAVLAGHGGAAISVHRTYEFGPAGDFQANNCVTGNEDLGTGCDPTGQTQDGSIDYGGLIVTPDNPEVEDGMDSTQASIVDDVFGPEQVGGAICTDENGDGVACDEEAGEVNGQFCGSSPVFDVPPAPEFDAVVVFINGAMFQFFQGCDMTVAPTSTTGGVLNPAGGVYFTFG